MRLFWQHMTGNRQSARDPEIFGGCEVEFRVGVYRLAHEDNYMRILRRVL